MSTTELRHLLDERVADLTTVDLTASAWRAARRARRRRRAVAVAGVAAGVVAAAGLVSVIDRPGDLGGPATAGSTSSVFLAPTHAEERTLLPVEGDQVLPEVIDLGAEAPSVETAPVARATAAFTVGDRIVLVTPDGYRSLDSAPGMAELSPDGGTLLFGGGSRLQTFALATGAWGSIETKGLRTAGAVWVNDELITLPQGPATVDRNGRVRETTIIDDAGRTAYGPSSTAWTDQRTAQAHKPATIVVSQRMGDPSVLRLDGRGATCCPVVGWLDTGTLAYESRGSEPRIVAWTVDTDEFRLVSRIEGLAAGATYDASFAMFTLG